MIVRVKFSVLNQVTPALGELGYLLKATEGSSSKNITTKFNKDLTKYVRQNYEWIADTHFEHNVLSCSNDFLSITNFSSLFFSEKKYPSVTSNTSSVLSLTCNMHHKIYDNFSNLLYIYLCSL